MVIIIGCFIVAGTTGLFPYQIFTVISGSMEPTIPTGSLIISYKGDTSALNVDDIIVFQPGEQRVMHRIVGIEESKTAPQFITRGDANNTNDGNPVQAEDVLGKVIMFIPFIGGAIDWMQSHLLFVAIGVGCIIIFENSKKEYPKKLAFEK
ncbi:MAG: signal peptidase I [Culicoidibacterales bacterium]